MAFGIMGNITAYSVTTMVTGGEITAAGMIGAIVGGVVAGILPGFQTSVRNPILSIGAEISYGAIRGAIAGGIGGGIASMLQGGDFARGFIQGVERGAVFGAIAAGVKIVLLGPASPPPPEIEQANRARGLGTYGPVYRSGGIVGWVLGKLGRPGIVLGRNIVVRVGSRRIWREETAHYFQQLKMSYSTFYGRMGVEYLLYGIHGVYEVPGTLEWEVHH
jgi:hypothetical protein